ncbi:MAG: nucleotide exchange factor GrpE [Bacteroidales bacterium]|nr:nucleotide exchange factor GrpE [Bacteroidales bacterium]
MEQQEDKIKEEAKQEVVQEKSVPQTENGAVADDKDKKEDKQESKKDRKKKCDKHSEAEEKVQELGEKLAEVNDKYLRIYSEYENYRKRTNAEKADLILNGGKDVIKAILPVLDDLERALSSMGEDDSHRQGVQLILNKLQQILQQKGLKAIDAKGAKFDENLHEAVTQFPAAEESQKGTVIDVVEKGYFLNDKVLRYAKVVVAI